MSFGPLAFLNPWLLAALVTLPVIYWLLRAVPPRPTQVEFPPTRILVGLDNEEKTAEKTPWWLTLIRLLAATLVIMALAEPVLNPSRDATLSGEGPVVVFVDNGWAAASRWPQRVSMIDRIIGQAESKGRPVIVAGTAAASKLPVLKIQSPAEARSTAAALSPEPFGPDREAAVAALKTALDQAGAKNPSIIWLHDGLDHESKAGDVANKLAALAGHGTFAVIDEVKGQEALGLAAQLGDKGKLEALVLSPGGPAREGSVYAYSARGERLGEAAFKLGPGAKSTNVTFDLPLELRNQVARIEIASERSAGTVSLIDAATQWHRVGLLSGESREEA
ncbi:MAG TPA: BatA domain-containing protein, partial [Hyphomicrobium sp.]